MLELLRKTPHHVFPPLLATCVRPQCLRQVGARGAKRGPLGRERVARPARLLRHRPPLAIRLAEQLLRPLAPRPHRLGARSRRSEIGFELSLVLARGVHARPKLLHVGLQRPKPAAVVRLDESLGEDEEGAREGVRDGDREDEPQVAHQLAWLDAVWLRDGKVGRVASGVERV